MREPEPLRFPHPPGSAPSNGVGSRTRTGVIRREKQPLLASHKNGSFSPFSLCGAGLHPVSRAAGTSARRTAMCQDLRHFFAAPRMGRSGPSGIRKRPGRGAMKYPEADLPACTGRHPGPAHHRDFRRYRPRPLTNMISGYYTPYSCQRCSLCDLDSAGIARPFFFPAYTPVPGKSARFPDWVATWGNRAKVIVWAQISAAFSGHPTGQL